MSPSFLLLIEWFFFFSVVYLLEGAYNEEDELNNVKLTIRHDMKVASYCVLSVHTNLIVYLIRLYILSSYFLRLSEYNGFNQEL